MAKTRWLSEHERSMWVGFVQMRRVLDLAIDRQLAEHGLSMADYEVLAPLSEAPEQALRPRDLGRANGWWDRSRLAHQIRRMEHRGLVARSDCAEDGRGTLVHLTDGGRAALTAAAPGHLDTLRKSFIDLLDKDEISVLTAVAEKVIAAQQARCPG